MYHYQLDTEISFITHKTNINKQDKHGLILINEHTYMISGTWIYIYRATIWY